MTQTNHDDIRASVRKTYSVIAEASGSCCGPSDSSCGDVPTLTQVDSTELGYSPDDLTFILFALYVMIRGLVGPRIFAINPRAQHDIHFKVGISNF